MCHHKLWSTTVIHPFSFLSGSLGLAGGKHYRKITIPIFRLVLQNFAILGYFPDNLFHCYLFSLVSSDWFVIAACGSISIREVDKYYRNCKLMTSQVNGSLHFFVVLFNSFFRKINYGLYIVCYLCEGRQWFQCIYRLWFHSLYRLHGPRFVLFEKGHLASNLISHSLC